MIRPAFQFYPGDWQRDAGLRSCSVGARGCWIEMICIMHQAEPYGHLRVNGKPVSVQTLARMIGGDVSEVSAWVEELEGAGIFDRDSDGAIISRRMVRDEDIRRKRAEGGKLGGNPALVGSSKVDEKVNLVSNLRPTPSSSSSSSSSIDKTPPNPPAGGCKPKRERKARTSLQTFIARCTDAGEKPISEYRPLLEYVQATGLPMEFVQLCWHEFKREFLPGGSKESRLQADWRMHFLNFVRKGYYRLWYAKADGTYELTTVGIQAKRQGEKEAA